MHSDAPPLALPSALSLLVDHDVDAALRLANLDSFARAACDELGATRGRWVEMRDRWLRVFGEGDKLAAIVARECNEAIAAIDKVLVARGAL